MICAHGCVRATAWRKRRAEEDDGQRIRAKERQPSRVRAVADFSNCPACGQVHDRDIRCGDDAEPLPILNDHDLNQLPDALWDIEDMTHETGFDVGYGPASAGMTTLYPQRAFGKTIGAATFLGFNVHHRG